MDRDATVRDELPVARKRWDPEAGVVRGLLAGLALSVIVAAAALIGAHQLAPVAAAAGDPRPNIVVVMTDDQAVESMRVMERTRSLLGENGTTFANSFVNFPLCCPSRATFFTGQYAHNHNVLNNTAPDGGFDKFFAEHGSNNLAIWLQDAGYLTAHVGKVMPGYGNSDPNLIPAGWAEWYANLPQGQRVYDYEINENGTTISYGTETTDFKQDVTTERVVDVIERRAPSQQPLFLSVLYTAPHAGGPEPSPQPPADCENFAKPAPRHADAFDNEPLPEPPSFDEEDVSDKPPSVQALPRLDSAERNRIQARYRCRLESLLSVDEGVNRIVTALRESDELDNTLIIFTSDNGFFHGEHRIPNGKNRHYEPSSRVPLIMRGPGIAAGAVVEDLVVNADVPATILDAANAKAGLVLDGVSLLPIAGKNVASIMKTKKRQRQRRAQIRVKTKVTADEDLDVKAKGKVTLRGVKRKLKLKTQRKGLSGAEPGRGVLIEHRDYGAIRTDRYKYVEHTAGADAGAVELYDLDADPDELRNRAGDASHSELRSELADRLSTLLTCAGSSCDDAGTGQTKVFKLRPKANRDRRRILRTLRQDGEAKAWVTIKQTDRLGNTVRKRRRAKLTR